VFTEGCLIDEGLDQRVRVREISQTSRHATCEVTHVRIGGVIHADHPVTLRSAAASIWKAAAMALSATLFDMDGLLLDSEILWHRAEVEILGGLGVPIPDDGSRGTKGMFVTEVVDHWHQVAPWSAPSRDDVVLEILNRVGELVESEGRLMNGAVRALDLTGDLGPVAIASSTPRPLIERSLRHFGLLDRFSAIATAADELFGKPHPAVFLAAARALAVPATSCLTLEDSEAGVLAAKAARTICVAVPSPDERGRATFQIADLVLDSLADLREEWLKERFSS
jgi:sugar-phosphatase